MTAPAGLRDPQSIVEVELIGPGQSRTVTRNCVVAALVPLTIGICLPTVPKGTGAKGLQLRVRESDGRAAPLGTIKLSPAGSFSVGSSHYCLFHSSGVKNFCLAYPRRWIYPLWQIWLDRHRAQVGLIMSHGDLQAFFIFYCCPRPVVLVSVEHENSNNIFPMDLIGDTESGFFSIALRKTSPAIALMQRSRKLALSNMPIRTADDVYQLGAHHKKDSIDPASLPFSMDSSQEFGLPVPALATRIREVKIESWREVGSHVVFLTTQISEKHRSNEREFFHISGYYKHLLDSEGRTPYP